MTNLEWDDNEWPLAYLITYRTYGTWLHGDERRAVDRHGFNVYGSPRRPTNANLERRMKQNMSVEQVVFDRTQCEIVRQAIEEVCDYRVLFVGS